MSFNIAIEVKFMKKILFVFICAFSVTVLSPWIHAQSLDDTFDEFSHRFQALKPPPGSSVRSDYKLDQTALASFYTAKMLTVISKQNQELIARYDEVSRKYDQMIKQNEKIIQLLSQKPGRPE
ncbi:MAG: hypothetical protein C4576_12870 [Desulfobacteraceae bacterium]|nr:MAG: hypothetical protein C4576_12870 [Desulfobacteraceae bacterium]